MLGILLVFVASFMVLFIGTMIFPAMPPGQLICDVFGNSETNYLIAGVSGELFVSGIINGLVWGVIIVLVYSYWRGPSKGKVTLPLWVPGYTTSRSSTAVEHEHSKQVDEPSLNTIMKIQDIEAIEGIDYIYGRKLREIGITTLDDLLNVGYTQMGRDYLANNVGVTPTTIRAWVHQAESLR